MHSRPLALTAMALSVVALVGCTDSQESAESTVDTSTTQVSTTQASPTQTTSTQATPTQTTEVSPASPTSPSTTTRRAAPSATDDKMPPDVAKVYDIFNSLAGESVFRQFESCDSSGIDGAYECSGPEVGQFQFFQSNSKAASTTQLLTELRSSRVMEDTGSRVVGWSTLGTTAVITVVDNDRGLVMQQMVSSDQEDPEDKIIKLKLVDPAASPSKK